MSLSTIEGDLRVRGTLIVDDFAPPNSSIGNAQIDVADPINSDKLEHQYLPTYSQPNTTATTETRVIHVARAAGTIEGFRAGSIAACSGAATITFDLKKNGTTVLSSVITLDNANTARVIEAGTLSGSPTVAAGDVLEVVITATASGGTLGTGAFCQAIVREGAS